MRRKRAILKTLIFWVLLSLFVVPYASANKSSVTIEAPRSATRGSEVAIKINVSHNANNIFHYTKWVYVTTDGQPLQRWDYSWHNKPEGKEFTRKVTFILNNTTEIAAGASCNNHGGEDPVRWVIKVEKQ